MKSVIQRVKQTSLYVEGEKIADIPFGLVVFFGVKAGDTEEMCRDMAKKIVNLRVFEDENGKMNRSVLDVQGSILFVSQFTLYGDTKKGNRPSFTLAEKPERANALYAYAADLLRAYGLDVQTGVFGADMRSRLVCTLCELLRRAPPRRQGNPYPLAAVNRRDFRHRISPRRLFSLGAGQCGLVRHPLPSYHALSHGPFLRARFYFARL